MTVSVGEDGCSDEDDDDDGHDVNGDDFFSRAENVRKTATTIYNNEQFSFLVCIV